MHTNSLLLFLVLQLLDLWTTLTLYYIAGGDPWIEANPLARYILATWGTIARTAFKSSMLVVVGGLWLNLDAPWRRRVLDWGNGIMSGVVVNNCFLLYPLLVAL